MVKPLLCFVNMPSLEIQKKTKKKKTLNIHERGLKKKTLNIHERGLCETPLFLNGNEMQITANSGPSQFL